MVERIVLILALLCTPAWAIGPMLGGNAGEQTTASYTLDQSQLTKTTITYAYDGRAIGECWQSGMTGTLRRIDISPKTVNGVPINNKMRVGATANLTTTYSESDAATVPVAGSVQTFLFTAASFSVSSGSTYCFGNANTATGYVNRVEYDKAGNAYAGGEAYRAAEGQGWNMSTDSGDLWFRVYVE